MKKFPLVFIAAFAMLGVTAGARGHDQGHSLEADHNDVRAEGPEARARAQEAVGWRNEHGMRDPLVRIKLLGINDFHGQLSTGRLVAGRPVGSAAVLASYLKTAAANADAAAFLV